MSSVRAFGLTPDNDEDWRRRWASRWSPGVRVAGPRDGGSGRCGELRSRRVDVHLRQRRGGRLVQVLRADGGRPQRCSGASPTRASPRRGRRWKYGRVRREVQLDAEVRRLEDAHERGLGEQHDPRRRPCRGGRGAEGAVRQHPGVRQRAARPGLLAAPRRRAAAHGLSGRARRGKAAVRGRASCGGSRLSSRSPPRSCC